MTDKKYIIDNEELMKEWDWEKNDSNGYNPQTITYGSTKKIFWKCSQGHEWRASPTNRSKGTGCPQCALKTHGQRHNDSLIKSRGSLMEKNPNLAKEWNYEKNYPLTPNDVTCGSGKKVWWKCENGHEWQSRIDHRSKGTKCIYCVGQKAVSGMNDIGVTHPYLLEEWDFDKNGDLKPENFKAKSNIKIWWKCELGHSWCTTISHRTEGNGCPHCYSEYGTSFPEQAICYYLSKITKVENRSKVCGQEIDVYLPDLKIGFEYDGSYYHSSDKSKILEDKKNRILYEEGIVLYRIKESDKFECDLEKRIIYCVIDKEYLYLNSVLNYIQQILKVEIKNVDIVNDSMKIYKEYINSIKENSIARKNPNIAREWDCVKNEGLLPENFTAGSNKKVWWICNSCGSSYQATVAHRVEGTSCPYCNGKKVNETNNLKSKYPELAKTWDYNKNGTLTPENVYFSSRTRIWWICPKCKKSFQAPICSRIKSDSYECDECMHKSIGKANQLIAVKRSGSMYDHKSPLIKEWDFDKNNPLTPHDVTIKSGKRVWWKCSKCGHEWEARIVDRTNGRKCQKCRKGGESNA